MSSIISDGTLCRVCIASNRKLHSVKYHLQEVYEILTREKFNQDGYPSTICYFCLQALQECHKLMVTARESNNFFKSRLAKSQSKKLVNKVEVVNKNNFLNHDIKVEDDLEPDNCQIEIEITDKVNLENETHYQVQLSSVHEIPKGLNAETHNSNTDIVVAHNIHLRAASNILVNPETEIIAKPPSTYTSTKVDSVNKIIPLQHDIKKEEEVDLQPDYVEWNPVVHNIKTEPMDDSGMDSNMDFHEDIEIGNRIKIAHVDDYIDWNPVVHNIKTEPIDNSGMDSNMDYHEDTEIGNRINLEHVNRGDTHSEYESGAPGPSTQKTLRAEIVHKKCVSSKTPSTDNKSRSESTKASTTSRKKTNAQMCREYRERKKLQNKMLQNITTERSDECTDQLQAKRPKTNAERRRKHYEKQKLMKQTSKKIPKSKKQINKEYYERKKKLQALNTLNLHSDVAKKQLLNQQSDQNLEVIISTSSSKVNPRASHQQLTAYPQS